MEDGVSIDLVIKIHIEQVVSTNQIPNERCEYVLCTTYLSKNDRHALYIENKDDSTGILTCINSWGQCQPHPIILGAYPENIFFKIEIEVEPSECKNCAQAKQMCKAYADVIDNHFFQLNTAKETPASFKCGSLFSLFTKRYDVLTNSEAFIADQPGAKATENDTSREDIDTPCPRKRKSSISHQVELPAIR